MDARLSALITRALATDGNPPFSDGALVELAHGQRELIWLEGEAAALATATSAEFVVDPDARRHGLGGRMLELLLTRGDELFWAHGDHPGARALARTHGLDPVRTLLHLEATVPGETPRVTVDHLTEDDADEWLALNARAFAEHPEQGAMSRADLDTLVAEGWFDPEDFLLLREGARLIGYNWLKVEADEGEFYVVGVDPDRQGAGWGRRLVEAGFARLAERGIPRAHLYVEGDNAPALRLYRNYGFAERGVDVQYKKHTGR
jgi:mycothiol synthase